MQLRRDSRQTLTNISKKTGVPISTIYDKIRLNKGELVNRHTCLLDFSKIGFACRVNIAVKVRKEERAMIRDFFIGSENINNLYRINNGYDFLIEGVFKDVKEVEEFMDRCESRFDLLEVNIYYIIDEIKRESFLTEPLHVDMVGV